MFVFIIDLHMGDARELFHRQSQRFGDIIRASLRPAVAGQIDPQDAVCELYPAISHKAARFREQAAALFRGGRPLKILVQDGDDGIGRGRNLARHRLLEGRGAVIDPVPIREVDLHFDG
jgi:hypothetical protein